MGSWSLSVCIVDNMIDRSFKMRLLIPRATALIEGNVFTMRRILTCKGQQLMKKTELRAELVIVEV